MSPAGRPEDHAGNVQHDSAAVTPIQMPQSSPAPQTPETPPSTVIDNPWSVLRALTPARIGLGRTGISLPTAVQLDFQLAHAQARDAVHRALDVQALCAEVEALGLATVPLHSAASGRAVYLQRPDLGRQLGAASRELLERLRGERQSAGGSGGAGSAVSTASADSAGGAEFDVAFVMVDGLSSLAVQRHAAPLLAAVLPRLGKGWSVAPVAVVEQGRVAVGDGIGELLDTRLVVVMIGERPGLSSPDSLGLYLTWAPRTGRSDAERNCISNVRPEGLSYDDAAARLVYLLVEARRRGITGVALKDESGDSPALQRAQPNFLLGES